MAGANNLELYALPFDSLLFWFWWEEDKAAQPGRRALWAGLLTAGLFLFRPNMIATGLVYLVLSSWAAGWGRILALMARFGAGVVAGMALVVLPLLAVSSSSGIWDASVAFNLQYIEVSGLNRKYVFLFWAAERLMNSGLFALGLAAVLGGIVSIREYGLKHWGGPTVFLVASLTAAAVSGRLYGHYLIPALPSLTFLTAYFLAQWRGEAIVRPGLAKSLGVGSLLVLLMTAGSGTWNARKQVFPEYELGRRIQDLTVPGERVYLWISNRSGLAFTTGRPSASRYFTPTYFFHNPKILARLFPVWWKDMEDSKPRIVADCGAPDMPWLFRGTASRVGLPGQDAGVWWDAEWQQRLATLEGKYEWLFTDASQGCAIYRRR